MGSCQNYGPFLGTLDNRCRIIIGTQKGTLLLLLTTTLINTLREQGINYLGLSQLRSPKTG